MILQQWTALGATPSTANLALHIEPTDRGYRIHIYHID